jgi:hypothetical protein
MSDIAITSTPSGIFHGTVLENGQSTYRGIQFARAPRWQHPVDIETYDLLSSIRLGRYQVVGNEFIPVYDRTPLEDQWLLVRLQRDEKLQQSDWTVIRAVDEGNPIPTDWQTYRQQLREITNQTDPFHIIWPVAPN